MRGILAALDVERTNEDQDVMLTTEMGTKLLCRLREDEIDIRRDATSPCHVAAYIAEETGHASFNLRTRRDFDTSDAELHGSVFLPWATQYFESRGKSVDVVDCEWRQLIGVPDGDVATPSTNFEKLEEMLIVGAPQIDAVSETWSGHQLSQLGYEMVGNIEYESNRPDPDVVDAVYWVRFVRSAEK